MELFDKMKKAKEVMEDEVESAKTHAKADDLLIREINKTISERWQKVAGKKPLNVAG